MIPHHHNDADSGDGNENGKRISNGDGERKSGPLTPYGTLLTDTSGARSYVWSKVLGVYQDAAQRGRARGESRRPIAADCCRPSRDLFRRCKAEVFNVVVLVVCLGFPTCAERVHLNVVRVCFVLVRIKTCVTLTRVA